MATVLEFELSADDVERIMTVPGVTRRVGIFTAILGALGIAGIADGAATATAAPIVTGVAAFVLASMFAWQLRQIPRTRATMAVQLTGPAKVTLADAGVQYAGAQLARDFGWDRVAVINDRPGGWVMTVNKAGSFIIPKSAVAADRVPVLAQQLSTWVRGRYRIRRK